MLRSLASRVLKEKREHKDIKDSEAKEMGAQMTTPARAPVPIPSTQSPSDKSEASDEDTAPTSPLNDSTPPPRDRPRSESRPIRSGIDFELKDDLIYHVLDGRKRLCIPNATEKDVFQQAHDNSAHAGHHRAFYRITETLYVHRLSKKLKLYIKHCPACQLNQTY